MPSIQGNDETYGVLKTVLTSIAYIRIRSYKSHQLPFEGAFIEHAAYATVLCARR